MRTAGGGRREIRLCVLSVLYFCLSEFRPFSAILYASSLCVSLSPLPLSVVLWHRFLDGYSDKAPFFVCRRYYRRYSYFYFFVSAIIIVVVIVVVVIVISISSSSSISISVGSRISISTTIVIGFFFFLIPLFIYSFVFLFVLLL